MWDKEIVDRRHSENKKRDLDPIGEVIRLHTLKREVPPLDIVKG